MASFYLTNVTGDGSETSTFRAFGFDGASYACLMIDTTTGKALVVSTDDAVTGAGVNNLFSAATLAALKQAAKTTNVNATKRNQINTWLTSGGYTTLPAGAISWWDALHFIARQVNAAADLTKIAV